MHDQIVCACGSGRPYQGCCQFLHMGKIALTAELLMRSRYSAYFYKLVDYIYDTTHPAKQSPKLKRDIESWIMQPIWNKLEIIKLTNGNEADKVGKVEFIAHYQLDGKQKYIHEISQFKRYNGLWKYLDGQLLN